MKKSERLLRAVEDLARRIEMIEARLGEPTANQSSVPRREGLQHCCTPIVRERVFDSDVSERRERLIRYIDRKWVNGTKLRYTFFENDPLAGPESEKDLVREGFEVWSDVGIGLGFEEVPQVSEAEIRISFDSSNGRTWSYVGRDVIDIPGQGEPTMTYGWSIAADPRGVDVAVHEIGHTLGFPHEHQNPFAGIVWNEEAVYAEFAAAGWSAEETRHNVLNKLRRAEVQGTEWDPNSIMHYDFGPGLILHPQEYSTGLYPTLGSTDSDRSEALKFYPPVEHDAPDPTLNLFELHALDIQPGEQKNFVIEPLETREYRIETLGSSDTVIVLFEDQEGDLKFVAGDDDSGTSLNAVIRAWLEPGRRYVLRVRLYFIWAGGETAIVMT